MTKPDTEDILTGLNDRLTKLEQGQEQAVQLLHKIYHLLQHTSTTEDEYKSTSEGTYTVLSLDATKEKATNDRQFSYDNMIERPTTLEGHSRRKLKIKSEHIREYVIYADDRYDTVVTSAKETALKKLCKLAVQDLKNHIEKSLGVNIVPWGDISVDMRENVIKRMERLANDQFGIPLHRCEGSWAADHLIRQAWSNSYGHIKRSREKSHNKEIKHRKENVLSPKDGIDHTTKEEMEEEESSAEEDDSNIAENRSQIKKARIE